MKMTDKNRIYHGIEEERCPICGRLFVPAVYHTYKDSKGYYCSYTCYNRREQAIEERNVRRVCQYTLDGELVKIHKDVQAAADAAKCTVKYIRKCLTGKYPHGRGYVWKYE